MLLWFVTVTLLHVIYLFLGIMLQKVSEFIHKRHGDRQLREKADILWRNT
jgi:hypothetical protein